MHGDDDAALLKRFLDSGAQEAFAEIVRRRVGLVYSVALRRTRDVHRAEEATQFVFIQLALHAAHLTRRPLLLGWFYRAAYNAATDIVRSDCARIAREQEHFAITAQIPVAPMTADWAHIRPILDDAMQELSEADRDAVLMRFFDGHSFASIGDRLHLNENSARMRVHRALEKLHAALRRRGVNSSAAIISSAFAAEHVSAVPSGLVEKAITSAIASATTAPLESTILTMKTMKLTAAATALFLGAAATMVFVRKNAPEHSDGARIIIRATNIDAKPPAGVPAPRPSRNQSAQAVSRFQLGERMSGADMADRGQVTPKEAWRSRYDRLAGLLTGSTPQALDWKIMRYLLAGAPETAVELTVRATQGNSRTVTLPRITAYAPRAVALQPQRTGSVIRLLKPGIAYIDLDRLLPGDVEPMFNRFADTKAMIFDLRGYPRGTVF